MSWQPLQIKHEYPENIVLLDDPYLNHLCGVASGENCGQPQFNRYIKKIFKQLFIQIMNGQWPKKEEERPTRMTTMHPEVKLKETFFEISQKAVCVDVARAGMLPAQIFFDELNEIVTPQGLRLDHIFASRVTNEKGEVTHTELNSSKIGGDVDDAILLIPDPMGATGSSLCEVIDHYKNKVDGKARQIISAHMIITPEFIRKITETHPDVIVYSARLDRGFSPEKVLSEVPGKHWDEEKGLNDSQYIVPGAGGVGELINNSFV